MKGCKTICKWVEEDEQMLVSTDGQVLPCCYLSGYFRLSVTQPTTVKEWDKVQDQLYHRSLVDKNTRSHYLFQEYQKRRDKLNLFTNDLEDILANDWFTTILPKSWESKDTIAGPCYRICTESDNKGKINIDTM
jgi:hypothetical protein